MLRPLFLALVLALVPQWGHAVEPMRYIYPVPESAADQPMDYYWDVLKAALDATTATWGPYELGPSRLVMNAERSQILLSRSQEITMLARTTTREREKVLLPLRIPLDKGLTGYRLFLIQKATQSKLDKVQSLEDLKAFRIGQGEMWVDTTILRHAGLTVEAAANYKSLLRMLSFGRFELLSRGVNEIGKELAAGRATHPDLAIESKLLLYYPLPRYIFFARSEEGGRLARRAEEGVRILIKNGEYDRMYKTYKRQVLADVRLTGRRLFKVPNPTLSPETPLTQPEYWDMLVDELNPPH